MGCTLIIKHSLKANVLPTDRELKKSVMLVSETTHEHLKALRFQTYIYRPIYPNTHLSKHVHEQSNRWINWLIHLLATLSLPQVSSPLVSAVFCPLSTTLQYWWGLEVQPAAGLTVWGTSYTVSVLEWFVYLKSRHGWGYDVCACVLMTFTVSGESRSYVLGEYS